MEPGAGDLLVRQPTGPRRPEHGTPVLLGNMGLGKDSASQWDEACSGDERPELRLPRHSPRLPAAATRIGDFALQSDGTRGRKMGHS